MTDLIAKRAFRYGTRQLAAGEQFTAPEALARFYEAVGRARRTGSMRAVQSAKIEPQPDQKPKRRRRTYKRRDMRAED